MECSWMQCIFYVWKWLWSTRNTCNVYVNANVLYLCMINNYEAYEKRIFYVWRWLWSVRKWYVTWLLSRHWTNSSFPYCYYHGLTGLPLWPWLSPNSLHLIAKRISADTLGPSSCSYGAIRPPQLHATLFTDGWSLGSLNPLIGWGSSVFFLNVRCLWQKKYKGKGLGHKVVADRLNPLIWIKLPLRATLEG